MRWTGRKGKECLFLKEFYVSSYQISDIKEINGLNEFSSSYYQAIRDILEENNIVTDRIQEEKKMNLKLVTYELDLTQFLMEVSSDEEAVAKAIKANVSIEPTFTEYEDLTAMTKEENYTVKDVDFSLLTEILKRNDIYEIKNDVVIYFD